MTLVKGFVQYLLEAHRLSNTKTIKGFSYQGLFISHTESSSVECNVIMNHTVYIHS